MKYFECGLQQESKLCGADMTRPDNVSLEAGKDKLRLLHNIDQGLMKGLNLLRSSLSNAILYGGIWCRVRHMGLVGAGLLKLIPLHMLRTYSAGSKSSCK